MLNRNQLTPKFIPNSIHVGPYTPEPIQHKYYPTNSELSTNPHYLALFPANKAHHLTNLAKDFPLLI